MKNVLYHYKNMSKSAKAAFYFLICNLLQKAISFITIPIFTRIMSADEYGLYSIYTSWQSIICIFATLNLSYQVFNNGMVKYDDNKDGYTSSMIGLTIISSFICFILFLIFNGMWSEYTQINFVYTCIMLVDIFFSAVLSILTVRERYEFNYKILVGLTLFTIIFNPLIGIMFVLNFKDKVLGRILSVLLVNVISGIISLAIILKRNKKTVCLNHWKYALKLDMPLIPHYLALILLNSSDRIMIGQICGNSYSAYYSVAYNVAVIMNIVINSLNSSFIPWIYQKLQSKSYGRIQKNTSYLVLLVGFLSILPMFFGPEIVRILGGEDYYIASYVIPIISASVFMTYMYSLFINVELFYEKSKYVTIGSVLATAVNIILNLIFIPKYGFLAAGYTTLISYIGLAIFHYIFTKKIMQQNQIKHIFNTRLFVVLGIVICIFAILIQTLYMHIFIRYIFLGIILMFGLINRKKIINIYKKNSERSI